MRYLLKEVVPQFLSTLIIFSALIVVSQLVRLSEVLVAFGLTVENIFLPFLYIVVPFLPIVIPMGFLFAVMISFSRLSNDGELTALLAAGYSLKKALAPVMLVALCLYGTATLCAMHLEAWGRREFVQFIYRKTQTEIDNMIRFKIQPGVFLSDFLGYVIYTEKISSNRTHYTNVLLAPRTGSDDPFVMTAPAADIKGSVAKGDLRMILYDGLSYAHRDGGGRTTTLQFKLAEIDLLRVFQERIIGADSAKDDYRSYTEPELRKFVGDLAADPKRDERTYLKASYLWHSRFANPFVVLTFAILGLIQGVQEQRHGKSRGYVTSILTLMASFVLMVSCRWLAERGHMAPVVAAWLPQALLFSLALFCIYQKNRLPIPESIWARRNLPFFKS